MNNKVPCLWSWSLFFSETVVTLLVCKWEKEISDHSQFFMLRQWWATYWVLNKFYPVSTIFVGVVISTMALTKQSYGFSSSYVQMWELDHKEGWALKNWCFQILMLKMTFESPLEARRSNQSKSTLNIHWKDHGWSRSSNTLATWCEELTHLKWPWCWERLKVGVEGDNRGWDGWMASLTQWTWIWANSNR